MPSNSDRINYLREAGAVRRCHAMTVVGDTYNVAVHSFNALTLLLSLNPNASSTLIQALLFHDCAERIVGDVPFPTRKQLPEAAEQIQTLEEKVLEHYQIGPWVLTESEENWLKGCDLMEFWLYCIDQRRLGNRTIDMPTSNIRGAIHKAISDGWLPSKLEFFFNTHVVKRGPDYL